MKTPAALALVAATILLAGHAVDAKSSFLGGLPNGSSFSKSLGHSGNGFTAFGEMFSGTWSPDLCKKQFPGSSITVGQAFGDPCCTWKKGAKPDFAVSQTADFPAQSTQTCAGGGGGGSSTPAGAQPSMTPGAGVTPTVTESTSNNKSFSFKSKEAKNEKKQKKEKKQRKSEGDDDSS